jgi:molecular chaperone DnaJ
MSDPYSILGVDRNATDEDVKKAYRKLSRQYHPDANINNPKKDEAEAKFKEVQQAYQQIMDEREKEYNSGYGSSDGSGYGSYGPFGGFGGFGSYGYGSAGSTGGTSGMSEEDAHLNAAANYIRSGHYKEALNVLAGISQHSARWYFYSASANSGLGNNVTALEDAREAGFITALYILIVPILGLAVGKKAGIKVWIGVVLAVIGMYFLCMTSGFSIAKGDFRRGAE